MITDRSMSLMSLGTGAAGEGGGRVVPPRWGRLLACSAGGASSDARFFVARVDGIMVGPNYGMMRMTRCPGGLSKYFQPTFRARAPECPGQDPHAHVSEQKRKHTRRPQSCWRGGRRGCNKQNSSRGWARVCGGTRPPADCQGTLAADKPTVDQKHPRLSSVDKVMGELWAARGAPCEGRRCGHREGTEKSPMQH